MIEDVVVRLCKSCRRTVKFPAGADLPPINGNVLCLVCRSKKARQIEQDEALRRQGRAVKILRALGFVTWEARSIRKKVEGSWVTITSDLWGVVDVAGLSLEGFLFAQVTTPNGKSERMRKIAELPWPTSSGHRVELWVESQRGRFERLLFNPSDRTWTIAPTLALDGHLALAL